MISHWYANTALRIATLIIAVVAAVAGIVQLWPSPSMSAFQRHQAKDIAVVAEVRNTFRGRLLHVAEDGDKNSFYRLSTQLVLVEDAIERATTRKARSRVLQLRQQKKDLDAELGRLIDQMKKREGMRR